MIKNAGTSRSISTSSTVRFPLTANLVPIRKAAQSSPWQAPPALQKSNNFFHETYNKTKSGGNISANLFA